MGHGSSLNAIRAKGSAYLAQQLVDIAMVLRDAFDKLVELLYKATYLEENQCLSLHPGTSDSHSYNNGRM